MQLLNIAYLLFVAVQAGGVLSSAVLPRATNDIGRSYIGSFSCAVSVPAGDTLVFFQGVDSGIYMRSGSGPASSSYVETTVLGPAIARNNTPLACTLVHAQISAVRLYYVGTTANGLADQLHEIVVTNTTTFITGALDGLNVITATGSNYIYAISNAGGDPRVGYQCGNGDICEYNFDGTTQAWINNMPGW